jgi:hypothetical protein
MAKKEKIKKPFNLQSKITSALRKVWRYSPEKHEAIAKARDIGNPKHVICNNCKASVHEKLIAVDHDVPVVGPQGFVDWNTYIDNMFKCGVDNLKVMCEFCHKAKTKEETKARAEYKKSLKPTKVKNEKKASKKIK